jgi:multidrug resistance protein, MATE family
LKTEPSASKADKNVHRRIWWMAGPIIFSNITVPLLGLVDTAVVGHLPEAYYIGAVGLGAMLFNFIYHAFNCLRMGTTGPTAQALGAGNFTEVRALIGRALILATIIGAGLILLQLPIVWAAFWYIEASAEVEHLAERYFLIRVWAAPAAIASYAIIGWFYGLEDAKVPLILQLIVNAINIVLDLLFVFGFGWGVEGVAAASVIAEYSGLILGIVFVRKRLASLPKSAGPIQLFDAVQMRRMLSINRDIFFRTLCVVSVSAMFLAKSAQLGDLPLAANQILANFLFITSYGLDGFAHAAETLVGQAVGARDRSAFSRAVRSTLIWAGVVAALNGLVYWLVGPWLITVITSIEPVQELAMKYLLWVALMPAVSVWAYTYDGIYLGATRTKVMRNTVIIAFLAFLGVLHVLMPLYGNAGIWAAMTFFLCFRGAGLALYYPKLLRSVTDSNAGKSA